MTLHSSQIGGAGVATAALKSTSESKKSTATSFSAALKDASTTAESTETSKAPSSEKTRAVDGHKYSDITAGPRKGMFLNTGSNSRSGEAFVMVRKNGREYHIYGTGENRRVIGLKTADEKKSDATSTTDTSSTPTGTTDTGKITTDTSTSG